MKNDELESIKYFMAAERVGNLICQLEMMMEFVEEFKIIPDEEVKKALKPKLDELMGWLK